MKNSKDYLNQLIPSKKMSKDQVKDVVHHLKQLSFKDAEPYLKQFYMFEPLRKVIDSGELDDIMIDIAASKGLSIKGHCLKCGHHSIPPCNCV